MIRTDQGDFLSLSHLRYAYIKAFHGNPPVSQYFNTDEWNDDLLHISDLGKCPRQQILRISGAKKKTQTLDKAANDELMFLQGNWIHALTVGACSWAGILRRYEEALPLPPGWTGHFDLFREQWLTGDKTKLVGWDGKTVRSNAFTYWYEWPKIENVRQAQGYLRFLSEVHYWEIEYIDRGGSNTPWVFRIDRDDQWVDERMDLMDEYLKAVGSGRDLPPMLRPQYKLTYRKQNNVPIHAASKIYLANSWQCEWCDYHYASNIGTKGNPEWKVNNASPCKPEMKKLEVGSWSKGQLHVLDEHRDAVNAWLGAQTLRHVDPRAEVEVESAETD